MTAGIVKEPRAPFPYFGGKRNAAGIVWEALGKPRHYIEPFCGSMAILLARPKDGRGLETVNDKDAMLVNVWRSIRNAPDEVAHECAIPVMECELHARLASTKERMTPDFSAWIEGDESRFDSYLAANWLYCTCASIGECWSDDGPWRRVKEADGEYRLRDTRKLPDIGDAGRGINRELPHLGDAGQGGDDDIFPHEADVRQYLRALARRLERVRICCGDWLRAVSTPASIFAGQADAAVFLDPPYSVSPDLYACGDDCSAEVREWCARHGGRKNLRIALCGFNEDHDALLPLGWRKVAGRAGSGGYNKDKSAHRRERIWFSPACINNEFDFGGTE